MRIPDDVLAVLRGATIEGNNLKLTGQLARDLYERTNKVLVAIGGKWNRKAGAHAFDGSPQEAIDKALDDGAVTTAQDVGFFPTPPNLARYMIERANVRNGMRVLEPSAGRGAIAFELSARGCEVDAVELLPENAAVLRASGAVCKLWEQDFLEVDPGPWAPRLYDRVVMNPPFAKQADIRHVLHALRFLKPNGLLVAIMAAGVAYRDNALANQFRDLVERHGGTMEALPSGSFKPSGTDVNTVLVTIPGADAEQPSDPAPQPAAAATPSLSRNRSNQGVNTMNATATATPTASIDTSTMGIIEFRQAIADGTLSTKAVLDILSARIDKRILLKKPLIAKVVEYRNELAEAYSAASGQAIAAVPVPKYLTRPTPMPAGTLPSDPKALADLVFQAAGPKAVGDLIQHLTARIVAG